MAADVPALSAFPKFTVFTFAAGILQRVMNSVAIACEDGSSALITTPISAAGMFSPATGGGTATSFIETVVSPNLDASKVEVARSTAVELALTIGAVYVTGFVAVDDNVPPPETMDHTTPVVNGPVPCTLADTPIVPPSLMVELAGLVVTLVTVPTTGLTVTFVVPFFVVSPTDVALMTTVCCVATVGAVYVTCPPLVEESVPPPETIIHVTPLLNDPVPATVAVSVDVAPAEIAEGEAATVTDVIVGVVTFLITNVTVPYLLVLSTAVALILVVLSLLTDGAV